jgi:pimeloyl-ACP methyl ester carboxylesterase
MTDVPVLLLHGFATSAARTWGENGWLDLLRDMGRTVLAPDLLGHGTAPKPHDPADYADLTARIAEALPDEPVDAVAFSLGAMTLLELAAREPHRFGRLVVGGIGESVFRDDPERHAAILAAVDGAPGAEDDNVGRLFAQYATQPGNDRAALAACLRRKGVRLTRDRLAAVDVPVLVAIGDRDFAGPGEPLVEALPDARLVVLRNTDHFATPESFAFIDAALEFLDALPA